MEVSLDASIFCGHYLPSVIIVCRLEILLEEGRQAWMLPLQRGVYLLLNCTSSWANIQNCLIGRQMEVCEES